MSRVSAACPFVCEFFALEGGGGGVRCVCVWGGGGGGGRGVCVGGGGGG